MEEENTTVLTDEQVDEISSTIEKSTENNESTKIMKDINEGKIENPDTGLKESVAVETEGNMCISTEDKLEKAKVSFDESLAALNTENISDTMAYTVDDIKNNASMNSILENQDFDISNEAILNLIDIMNKVRNKEDINIWKELHPEIKEKINHYLELTGETGYNATVNSHRNFLARELVDEFISNVTLDHYSATFSSDMENILSSVNEDISSIYKDYDDNRTKHLEAILSKVPEEDTEKRAKLTAVIDAIHDSYALDRMKNAYVDRPLKIKRIDIEKYHRVFNDFLLRYKASPYHMYDLNLAVNTLFKYNTEVSNVDNIAFLVAFCKFCDNYKVENVQEHAFMYYTIYNIALLDVYKGKDYEEFATGFLKNINDVIACLRIPQM